MIKCALNVMFRTGAYLSQKKMVGLPSTFCRSYFQLITTSELKHQKFENIL